MFRFEISRYLFYAYLLWFSIFKDEKGGMTDLAQVMVKDCKYDVSGPYTVLESYTSRIENGRHTVLVFSGETWSTPMTMCQTDQPNHCHFLTACLQFFNEIFQRKL